MTPAAFERVENAVHPSFPSLFPHALAGAGHRGRIRQPFSRAAERRETACECRAMATLSLDKAEALPTGPEREKYERSAAIWNGLANDMARIEGRAAGWTGE